MPALHCPLAPRALLGGCCLPQSLCGCSCIAPPDPHAVPPVPQVLACIGEQFSEGDEVCGIAVNIRPKGDRIELWTKTASNEAVQVGCAALHLYSCSRTDVTTFSWCKGHTLAHREYGCTGV